MALAMALPGSAATATTLLDAQASILFDLGTWSSFGLTPNTSIGAAGNSLPVGPGPGEDLLDTPGSGFSNPQIFTLNPYGIDVTPAPRRLAPPTSFTYDASDVATLLASASGNISLAGVTRWTVLPDLGGGQLLFGDYSLAYNATDDRWELSNNIDFPGVVFLVGNAQVTTGPSGAFSVSGDLIGAPFLGALLAGSVGQDFGNISFTAVPEPSSAAMLVLGMTLLASRHRRRRHDRKTGQTRSAAIPMLGLAVAAALGGASVATATTLDANTTAAGIVHLSYDRAAWATNAPSADYYDIHGNPTGTSGPTADADGQRWIFPQKFVGTSWVAAVYPDDYLVPLPENVPVAQPAGGFSLPVNTYLTNGFAPGHEVTTYNSSTNPGGAIGLGGSFRAASDFNEPGASVWWEHLALKQDQTDLIWRLFATSGAGTGSIFELINVTTETIDGKLHLSADYKWGNTDWLQFLQDVNGHLDTAAVLGHIELEPVPEPGSIVLLGFGLMGLCARARRRDGASTSISTEV